MNREERRHAAEAILSIPFFDALMDELEHAAINSCIFAKHDDHEARQAFAAEARAIKQVRSRLAALSKDGQAPVKRQTPA
ncbi:MAG: hypothetical protein QHC90_25305 [Shinella sp.]|nr:hypothetical protein [Shinella sp.]